MVETRGEDFAGDLAIIRAKRAEALGDTVVALAQTPDFSGSIEEGWAAATTATIKALVADARSPLTSYGRVNILPGSHLTVADIDWLRDAAEAFGLKATILPDISGSLDGSVKDSWVPTSYGGTRIDDIKAMGRGGAHHRHRRAHARTRRGAAAAHGRRRLGDPHPDRARRRRQAGDAAGRDLGPARAPALPPRPLAPARRDDGRAFPLRRQTLRHRAASRTCWRLISGLSASLGRANRRGRRLHGASPSLRTVQAARVQVGDLGLLEELAESEAADLIIANAHADMAAEKLASPLFRLGFPIFDRLGSQHQLTIGYEGAMSLIFAISNVLQAAHHRAHPRSARPLPQPWRDP